MMRLPDVIGSVIVARKKSEDPLPGTTVRAPFAVAAALGDYQPTELARGLRIATVVLEHAAIEVYGAFQPAEWEHLADLFEEAFLPAPEVTQPGPVMASIIDQVSARTGQQAGPTDAKSSKGASLQDRVRGLSYPQAWAVLIAIDFRRRFADRLDEGARWWELPVRWALLDQERQRREKNRKTSG